MIEREQLGLSRVAARWICRSSLLAVTAGYSCDWAPGRSSASTYAYWLVCTCLLHEMCCLCLSLRCARRLYTIPADAFESEANYDQVEAAPTAAKETDQ